MQCQHQGKSVKIPNNWLLTFNIWYWTSSNTIFVGFLNIKSIHNILFVRDHVIFIHLFFNVNLVQTQMVVIWFLILHWFVRSIPYIVRKPYTWTFFFYTQKIIYVLCFISSRLIMAPLSITNLFYSRPFPMCKPAFWQLF